LSLPDETFQENPKHTTTAVNGKLELSPTRGHTDHFGTKNSTNKQQELLATAEMADRG